MRQVSDERSVLILGNNDRRTNDNGFDLPNASYLYGIAYEPVGPANVRMLYTERTLLQPRWVKEETEVDLFVPDQADSVVKMLERRASGLPEPVAPLSRQPYYPTDPLTVQDAKTFLAAQIESDKKRLEVAQAELAAHEKSAKEELKAKVKEQEEFEAFKASKTKPNA